MQLKAIALHVPDLEEAEAYYRYVFNMELVGREAPLPGADLLQGDWATLPRDKDWNDARKAGIDLQFTSLRSGSFHLALFHGEPSSGTVFAIVLAGSRDDVQAIRDRLEDEALLEDRDDYLEFFDRYGFHWQLGATMEWSTPGEFAGRWLDA